MQPTRRGLIRPAVSVPEWSGDDSQRSASIECVPVFQNRRYTTRVDLGEVFLWNNLSSDMTGAMTEQPSRLPTALLEKTDRLLAGWVMARVSCCS
jgi:hypothetical protein